MPLRFNRETPVEILAGSTEYELEFTVVNKSSISHFYPYPNPFTTQMRFVFTPYRCQGARPTFGAHYDHEWQGGKRN
jgi:hypothetical protein